ncbi:YfhO family protein [Tautonia plasticadhaerens]|uniref:Bacterial membrane protein YfhO n=1 Tax=Tautonia plasticadhaerens TaxID=2527974 RepID=A0A518HAI1_9BACT|nr:YfhO family protein [Tautonia plasticadhaerens]QDV37853.1 Bacterial membrane protein YfhO [Tautonia plasticadhaerens]
MMRQDGARRDLTLVALAGAAALLALLAGPLLAGRFYLYDDLLTFHLPLRVFYARCLASGDDFRWFPDYFCGMDLHGEGQIGMLHPAHLVLYGLLPVRVALPAEFLLNYVVLLGGMVAFLRRRVGPSAAVVGGMVFTFFGYNILHFMHLNSVAVAAHLPWSLWLIDRLFRGTGRPALDGAGLALLTGSGLLLGHPQTAWYVKLVEGAYVLFLALETGRWRRVAWYAGSVGIGVLLGGVQLLPTWEALALSRRATLPAGSITMGSLHPLNLVQLVAPYVFLERYMPSHGGQGLDRFVRIHELGLYQGAAVSALLAWLALRWRALDPPARRLARGAALLAVISFLMALGDYGPFGWVLVHAPLIRSFRVPARYLLLVHLAVAVLAALAVDDLVRANRAPRSARWLALVPAAGLACWVGIRVVDQLRPGLLPTLGTNARVGFNLGLLVASAALVALAARRPRLGLLGLMLVMVADFTSYALYFHLWDTVPPLAPALDPRPEVPPVGEGDRLHITLPEPGVAYPGRRAEYRSGQLSMAGYRLTDGYVALFPARRLDYTRVEAQRLAGVAWAWDDDRDGGSWVAVPGPMPRARVEGEGPPARVAIRLDRPGRFGAEVDAPGGGRFVWNEAFHPGWTAAVDGEPATVSRADSDFMACPIPPGRHSVAFRFRPSSFRLGAAASGVGLALVVAVVLAPSGHSFAVRRRTP